MKRKKKAARGEEGSRGGVSREKNEVGEGYKGREERE